MTLEEGETAARPRTRRLMEVLICSRQVKQFRGVCDVKCSINCYKIRGILMTWRRPRLGRKRLEWSNPQNDVPTYLNFDRFLAGDETIIPIHHHHHQSLSPVSSLYLLAEGSVMRLSCLSARPSMVENCRCQHHQFYRVLRVS